MKRSNKEIELNYKAIDLYNIVLDIKYYPDYIPWCSKIEILKTKKNQIEANMFVDYKFFSIQKFTSSVIFDQKKLSIKTKYIDGPLKDLETLWIFKSVTNKKTKILFSVTFEFNNFFHQKITELFFPLIENKMIESFKKRASDILD